MKRRLLLFLLAVLCLGPALPAQLPTLGLRAHYPLDGNLLDASGNGNHGSGPGSTFVADRLGNAGQAMYLDGVGDSLVLPVAGYTPLAGDFSISLWLRTSDMEGLNVLALEQFPGDTTDNFQFRLCAHHVLMTVLELHYASYTNWNGSGAVGNFMGEGGSGRYNDGQWKHFILRRSNDTLQLWHQGFFYAEAYYTGTMGDALPFIVGAGPDRFHGEIDDLAFYDRAITPREIMQVFHDRRPFYFRTPKSTDAYVQGDTATIYWSADTTVVGDSVDLDYTTDGGATWLATGQNQLVDYSPFPFPLNAFPIGTEIEVRLRDRHNPAIEARTGTFIMSEYAWENMVPVLPFTARDGSGLLNYNGFMWLIGGWDPPHHAANNNTHSEIWRSSDGITWDSLGEAQWLGRHVSGWVVHDSAMWVIGGDPQSGNLRDVWRSTDGINWTQVLDTIPNVNPLRTMHMVASLGGNLLYMGGNPATYINENLSEVFSSPDGINWTRQPDAPWSGRGAVLNLQQTVDDQDTLWMLGGGRLWDRRCWNDVWKTGDGITWERVLESAPWDPRYWHSTSYFDGKLWLIGGVVEQTDAADVWYSENGIDWHELMHSPFMARHAASATTYDNALWLMCGIISNDVWRLRNRSGNSTGMPALADAPTPLLFPNPTTGALRATMDFRSAEVFDLGGKPVRQFGAGRALDLAGLPAGVYVVRMRMGAGRVQVSKVVKE
jgi:Concanavalin A-like lectin/glucanases superfamily